jgi:hypothetical protein
MRRLLAFIALLAAGGIAYAQLLPIGAVLSPRKWPFGVSVPAIANTDAVYPGCPTPPTSFGNVWNFSPSGSTQAAYTTAGVSLNPLVSPHQGDATHPWSSVQAVFKTVTGYTAPLLATVPGGQLVIQAGDEIVLATGSYGDLAIGASFTVGAEVINSPALTIAAGPGQTPLFTSITAGETSGLVLNGLKVQNHLSAHNPLVGISDGAVSGFTATNIILENMDVSSDTVANTDGWSQATWQSLGSEGIAITASDLIYTKMTCASVVNSHVYNVQGHNIGAINMWASNTLTANDEIDHFATDAIEYAGSNVAIRLNYVHDSVFTQPGDIYFMINNVQDQGNGHQSNITIDHNKVIESIDAAQLLNAPLGFYISSKGDITNFTAYDNLFAGTGGGLETGTTHNTLITNNSLMPGVINVQQGHAGILGTGTGPVGAPPSYVRITNNIASQIALAGSGLINIQADHNIVTNTTGNPWVYEYVYSTIFLPANAGALTTVAAEATALCGCSDTGVSNLMDGFGAGNEFTAVASGFPMSPPNWTPLSGSPAATMGGAVLIPPLTDYNGLAFTQPYNIGALAPTSAPNPTFVLPTGDSLHYISPTGSDAANGLTTGTAWLTPNHALNCGDVIIAAAGTYTGGWMNWGTVSNCPSTTGGIDGAGGIYAAVLLCGGADLEACQMSSVTTTDAMGVNKSNWAIEGFKFTAVSHDGFVIETGSTTTQIHHVMAINDICYNSQMGFQGNDNGANHNIPGNGTDYVAWVGDIAQNCAQSGFGVAGINIIALSAWDSVAGTHYYAYGDFSYKNPSTSPSDGEDYMIDSPGAHGYSQQIVVANDIGYDADLYCLTLTDHQLNVSSPIIKAYNLTCYADLVHNTGSQTNVGEINFGFGSDQGGSVITLKNNIVATNRATTGGTSTNAYAGVIGGTTLSALTDTGNFWYGIATVCAGSPCRPTSSPYSVTYFNSNSPSGTDTYGTSPGYTNTTDLLTNQIGVPTCTGFTSTTACMGWNANTSTLTTPSVISDLVPSASGTSGKGYQLSSTTCAANADYPTWLKGIVYLHWNGTIVTENPDLVTKPCGM